MQIKKSKKTTKWKASRLALMALTAIMTLTSCAPKHEEELSAAVPALEVFENAVDNAQHEAEHTHEVEESNTEESKEQEIVEETKEEDSIYSEIDLSNYYGKSIEHALELAGYPGDYNFRCGLAEWLGIENYQGTPEQNLLMLTLLGANNFTYGGKEYTIASDNTKIDDKQNDHSHNTPSDTPSNTPSGNNGGNTNGGGNNGDSSSTDKEDEHTHKWGAWMALDEKSEQRTCPTCGEKERRNHTFSGETKTTYEYDAANPDHHIKKTETSCLTCSYKRGEKTIDECNYSDYEYDEVNKVDKRTCKDCGHVDTKKVECEHELTDWHSINDKEDQRECKKCGTIYKKVHNFLNWVFKNKDKEQSICKDCGHELERDHTWKLESTTYENIETSNTEHNEVNTYECLSCEGKKEEKTAIPCDYADAKWEYLNGMDVKHCSEDTCKNTMERVHDHENYYGNKPDRTDNQNEYYDCSGCKLPEGTKTVAHNFGDDNTCDHCGYEREIAHSHPGTTRVKDKGFTPNRDQCQHWEIICTDPDCPEPHVDDEYDESHNWREPIEVGTRGDTKKTCDDCGFYIITNKNGVEISTGVESDSLTLLTDYAEYKVEKQAEIEIESEKQEEIKVDKEPQVEESPKEEIVVIEETSEEIEKKPVEEAKDDLTEETETEVVQEEPIEEELDIDEIQAVLEAYVEELNSNDLAAEKIVESVSEEVAEEVAVLGLKQ